MGLPAGWVTQVPAPPAAQLDLFTPDLLSPQEKLAATVNEQLKMLGNGVVPQQAAAAVAELLDRAAPPALLARLGLALDAAA